MRPLSRGYHAGMIKRLSGTPPQGSEQSEAERRTLELETLHAVGTAIAESLDEADVLQDALRVLVDRGWFTCGEAFRMREESLETVAVGLCSYEDVDACPVRPTTRAFAQEALDRGALLRRAGWYLLPVDGDAVLALCGRAGASPSFLEGVTALVGSALKRTHLHRRLSEKEQQRSRLLRSLLSAQEEERGRISRDLHDQIGQALTAILLGLDKSMGSPEPGDLKRLKELTSVTLGDVRRIALDLRPSVLDELGLEAGLRRYARDVHERYDLDVSVVATLPHRLTKQEETVLYRVVQEALTNVVRHAEATTISVVLTAASRYVQLVVEDDGKGFDPDSLLPAEKIGIMGMSERMELLGGNLSVESRIGGGCTVYARLPLR